MAPINYAFPKLVWVLVLVFQVVRSRDSISYQPPEDEIKTLVICENNQDEIDCPHGTIEIKYAAYGRSDGHTCTKSQQHNTNCKAANALDIVRQKCDNCPKCQLEATNKWFGDPCLNTVKYLKVEYICRTGQDTHFEIICESDTKPIGCPEGKIIQIKDASYGRRDSNTCPHISIKTNSCKAENSLSIVKQRCDNRRECHLVASNDWFGDPCQGTYKYLSVEYQCVQEEINKSHTVTICENNTEKLICSKGNIHIEESLYGRKDRKICPHPQDHDIHCKADNALQIVEKRCQHKKECELQSSNSVFGDPCLGTYKYLQVKYKCV